MEKQQNYLQLNLNKLKGRIVEVLGTREVFCEKMGVSHTTLYATLNGKRPFTVNEIIKACEVLDIPHDEIPTYFFNKNN